MSRHATPNGTPPRSEPDGSLPPAHLWWALLRERIERARGSLPRELRGTIQIEVAGEGGRNTFFQLKLDGPRTSWRDGLAATANSWIATSAEELTRLLREPVAGALRVHGDRGLVDRLFFALEGAPATMSWLAARAAP